ncbi:uncharacterized protein G2W53_011128 [Senna tora]|uniref:Uncharacterized protein n=1 Tax=Senna tora TaxID=362788 RepID=A0A834X1L0_9FABA|nr:uncharacterized protein G2W53_011128 [Senna tora]
MASISKVIAPLYADGDYGFYQYASEASLEGHGDHNNGVFLFGYLIPENQRKMASITKVTAPLYADGDYGFYQYASEAGLEDHGDHKNGVSLPPAAASLEGDDDDDNGGYDYAPAA